jgi:gliding motility-associated protein GldE
LETDPGYFLALFFVLLIFSGFFSGSETAYFSLNSVVLDRLAKSRDRRSQRIVALLSTPKRLLITILIGNTLVNVTAAAIATILTSNWFVSVGFNQNLGIILNVVVVTFLILVISEITPKIYAVKNAEKFARAVSLPLLSIFRFFYPLSYIIDKTISVLVKVFPMEEAEEEKFLHPNEFQALLDLGESEGELESDEKKLIHSIFEFGDTIVREIMIPRTDMVCISHDIRIEEVVKIIAVKGHTRIPVYEETVDQVQGIIHAKDLLPQIIDGNTTKTILDFARPALFVPEAKKIDDLLKVFQKERQHMAIVVDEYGGTAGLVTLEDVLEEIVGEIRDEYDQEQVLYKILDDKSYLMNAKIDIDSLNKLIHIDIPETDEYDTLGGFILDMTGNVPEQNEVLRYRDYELTMVKVEQNRIIHVKIAYKPVEEESDQGKDE